MNRKTLFMIVGLMVVALAVVGVGYALWFEDLKIHGDVTTGDLDIDFSPLTVTEYFAEGLCDEDDTTPLPSCSEKLATVDCAAVFSYGVMGAQAGDNEPADGNDPDYLGITVTGAYPSYTCQVNFDITSAGSVPVHLFAWYDTDSTFPAVPLECEFTTDVWTPVKSGDFLGQMHANDSLNCRVKIHFTNENGLLENTAYAFQYHFRACQWNEADLCDDFVAYPFNAPAK